MNKIYKLLKWNVRKVLSVLLMIMVVSFSVMAQSVNFTRIVNTHTGSTQGFQDGTLALAKFNKPYATAIDASGNMYVADASNHRIRKITPSGDVSTFAGNGTADTTNGTGTNAKFNQPAGVAVDASGNVYVADQLNHRIRKITPAGVVTTFAGSSAGFADGTKTAAKFNNPVSVAVDKAGNVYVGDYTNHRIRKITPLGVVSTLAGSGVGGFSDATGTAAQFYYPYGVSVDTSGTVYVGDLLNHRIRKISSAGVVTTLAGNGTAGYLDGVGSVANFNQPYGVAVDTSSGNVYVVDFYNQCIRKVTPSGVVSTIAGDGKGTTGTTNGYGPNAKFYNPNGITIDRTGNLYIGDVYNYRIRKIINQVLNPFSSTVGTASFAQGIVVSGSGLTSNLDVSAPSGYEISLTSSGGFSSNLSLSNTSGKLIDTIFIRLSATAPVGTNNGLLTLTSTGANTESLALSGTTVDRLNQTITFNSFTTPVTFGSSTFSLSATATSSLPVTFTSSNTSVATISNGVVTIVGAGSADITAKQSGNANYNPAPDVMHTLVVNKADQTITFNPLSAVTYNGPNVTLNATASSGLPITYVSSNPNVATISGNIVTIVGAGLTSITASQNGNNNYNAANPNDIVQSLTVNKASQTITFPSIPAKAVGDVFDPGATASSGDPITYESSDLSIATVSGNQVTAVSAGTVTIKARQAGNSNYLPDSATQTLVVKMNQTINLASTGSVTFGIGTYNPGATATSGLTVSYTSSNTSVATVSNNIITIVGAGTTNITASQPGNATYIAATPVVQQLVVTKADQTINNFIALPVKTYGDGPFDLTDAYASSGLPITYTSSNLNVATITNGHTVTIIGAGTVTITAIQDGNNNYNAANPNNLEQSLTVNKADQSVIFGPLTPVNVYGIYHPGATSTSGIAVVYTSDNLAVAAPSNDGTYLTILGPGSVNITATVPGNSNYNPSAISVTQPLTVNEASGILNSIVISDSRIYPNPTADLISIEPKNKMYGDLTLTISDVNGKTAFTSEEKGGEEVYKVDVSNLQSGVYVLELSNGKDFIIQRIVKK